MAKRKPVPGYSPGPSVPIHDSGWGNPNYPGVGGAIKKSLPKHKSLDPGFNRTIPGLPKFKKK